MAELADALDLGSSTVRCAGSSPAGGTIVWGGGGMAYTTDLKSVGRNTLRVRVPLTLP